jgi:hypothetical protein
MLPRVAQWRDLLIALHRLPEDDWLGYTHAHFPLAAFDEYVLRRGWAFARKGEAYLALTAFGGITLVKSGPGAYREVRSVAAHNMWLCQMGRKTLDGAFADFQKAILALPVTFATPAAATTAAQGGPSVALTTLRGQSVAFGWTGALTVDGQVQPLAGFRHLESPYGHCDVGAVEIEIRYEEWMLRLNFDMPEG